MGTDEYHEYFIAHIRVEHITRRKESSSSSYSRSVTPSEEGVKRTKSEVAQLTVRASDLDKLTAKVTAHMDLLEDVEADMAAEVGL